jgi:ABC-type bacteriocin/lantibiotic exporter with double-glycine peptidase domain
MFFSMFGDDQLRQRFANRLVRSACKIFVSLKGATLQQLMAHASALNFTTRPLRLEVEELNQLQLRCILHWNLNHFVVLKKVARSHIVILDPAVGERRLKLDEVSRSFTGVALELTPNADFEATDQRKQVKLSALTGKVLGLKLSLLQIFGIALALQLFTIASPLLNQLVVDDAIATYDRNLLTVMAIAFVVVLLITLAYANDLLAVSTARKIVRPAGLIRAWAGLRRCGLIDMVGKKNIFCQSTVIHRLRCSLFI